MMLDKLHIIIVIVSLYFVCGGIECHMELSGNTLNDSIKTDLIKHNNSTELKLKDNSSTKINQKLHQIKESENDNNDQTMNSELKLNAFAIQNVNTFSMNNHLVKCNELQTRKCDIDVSDTSIRYFQNKLLTDPHFVQFRIGLQSNIKYRKTSSVFKPLRWAWTPNTTMGPYPFLSWNIDYGLLSFGLLETCTADIPYINLDIKGNCNLTFGTRETSCQIVSALGQMLTISAHMSINVPYSYFCFLMARKELLNTVNYYASLYIIYPIVYISYECCSAKYNFGKKKMEYECPDKTSGIHRWDQTTLLPFLVGLLILAYCPIYFCEVLAWMSKREYIFYGNETRNDNFTQRYRSVENDDEWVFEDGKSPLTFGGLLNFSVFGLESTHPVLVSRLRRFICHLLIPSVIYFQLLLYKNGIGPRKDVSVKDLVDAGTPMGFLSILGSPNNRSKVFVPYLGGPVGVILLYYVLGILFIVFPRSLKQIIEDGLPSDISTNEEFVFVREPVCQNGPVNTNYSLEGDYPGDNITNSLKSPLFFRNNDIVKASMVDVRPHQLKPGYTRGATLMRCSIYMLCTRVFWSRVLYIQRSRIFTIISSASTCKKTCVFLFIPVYLVLCLLEVLCCVIYYGIPFCFYVVVIVKGASTGLVYLKEQITCLHFIFKYRIFAVFCVAFVFVLSSIYAYIVAIIFLKSFGVLSQIFVLCFISIIIYPSVSFGYIFFFTAAVYFCFRQIRHFGDVYSDLLSSAVELSNSIEGYSNNVTIQNGRLIISNLRYEDLKDIRVNGKLLDVSQNMLRTVLLHENLKIREKNNVLGIPKKLFDHLIMKFRPVHQQVLSLVLKVAAMAALIVVTLSISSDYVHGPTSEISEVMHVIFIIAVGTLPELIEVTISYRHDDHIEKEVEKREIEQSIRDFWRENNGTER